MSPTLLETSADVPTINDSNVGAKRICIVAPAAYGCIAGRDDLHFGGVERQSSLIARWLAARGHRVSLITWDEGQDDEQVIHGVHVIKLCSRSDGVPGLRFFHPRWSSLLKALARADAEVYYQSCAEYVTGQVALWCRGRGIPFVYAVVSDPECDPNLPILRTARERILYRYGIRKADAIIVQSEKQRRMMRDGFGLESNTLPMACNGPADHEFEIPLPPPANSARVLWVGRIAPVKRLEVLLDVAAALPQFTFDVVGGADCEAAYFATLEQRAAKLPNVTLHGKVSDQKKNALFKSASILCATSLYEGFPNTFLEAWSYGVPVISTVDPDNMIERLRLGIAVQNPDELVPALRELCGNAKQWSECSRRCRQHYKENHTMDAAMGRVEDIFLGLLQSKAAGQ